MTMLAESAVRRSGALASGRFQVRTARYLGELQKDWNGLVDRSRGASVFQRWEWIDAWSLAHGEKEIFAVTGFDGSRLVGILPLYVSRWPGDSGPLRVLRLLADQPDDAGSIGVIIEAGMEREFCHAAIAWLATQRSEWDAIQLDHLSPVPGNSALLDSLTECGWTIRRRYSPHSLLGLDANARDVGLEREIRAARKRLASRAVVYQRAESAVDIESALHLLFNLHQQRWAAKGKKGTFASTKRRDFYRLLSGAMSHAGALDMWSMQIDGKTVAVEFGLVQGDTRYSMQAGFDPAFSRFGVGKLLNAHILEAAFRRGLRCCDFLEGHQEYKSSLGAHSSQFINIRCAPPGTWGAAWVRASRVPALQRFWSAAKSIRTSQTIR